MVGDYGRHITKTGGTIMGQEGYITAMHAAKDLTDGYLLTKAVTKHAERVTQVEEHMAQMEEKTEEKFAMMFMQQPT